jgi:DNA mismatch repair protein MutS2
MANHNKGIVNGAMQFDEVKLEPLYQLVIGKPGSSYTFAIAERIGLPKHLINRARKMVDTHHFELDKLLNRTEQDLQLVQKERKELLKKIKENDHLQQELNKVLDKESIYNRFKFSESKIKWQKINLPTIKTWSVS